MPDDSMLAVMRAIDPLSEEDDVRTRAHVGAARQLFDRRITHRAAQRRRRRVVGVVAGAAALPIAAAVIAPMFGANGPSSVLTGTAVASDGRLDCGSGAATPIRPDSASPRPWPTYMPPGWKIKAVFARSTTMTGWCTAPSLVAAQTTTSGEVVGTVTITGPLPNIRMDARFSGDTIGGQPAEYVTTLPVTPAPAAVIDEFHVWIVADADGSRWYAAVNGYPRAEARSVLAAAHFSGGMVSWHSEAAPLLKVVHRRDGQPYPFMSAEQDWYLRVALPDGQEQDLRAVSTSSVPGTVGVSVGSRLIDVQGKPMRVLETNGRPEWIVAEVAPGVVMQGPLGSADLGQMLKFLASMRDIDADSPLLDNLALVE